MKVCLFLEGGDLVAKSGFRTAFENHVAALRGAGIEVTDDPRDTHDLLHTHFFGPKSMYYVMRARKRGVPVVCHAHSMGAHDFRDSFTFSNLLAPMFEGYLRYYYNQADAVFTCSRFAKRTLGGLGVRVPIHVVSNASDSGGMHCDEEKRKSFREKLGLEKFTFFSAGHLIQRKGVIDFFEIATTLPQYDFAWYGKMWGKMLTQNIVVQRTLSNPPPNLHLPGFVSDIEGAFSAGDALFFPSYTENQPMVILECAALGLPLVVRDIPEYEGFLTDGLNCLKAKSVEEFAQRLVAVAEDDVLRKKLRTGSLALAEAHDFNRVGSHLRGLYLRLIKRSTAHTAKGSRSKAG